MTTAGKFLASSSIVALGITIWLVVNNGQNEPFYGVVITELVVQVGGGTALLIFWMEWSLCLMWAIRTKEIARSGALGLFLSLVCCVFVIMCIWGYATDLDVFYNGES